MHEYRVEHGVAVLSFDDGKANAVGYEFIEHMDCLLYTSDAADE